MLIGITGGIGSGKSRIAQALRSRGYAVYDTDTEAKRIIVENPMVRSQVEMLFGSQVFEGDVYRTQLVAKQVFHHPDLLAELNHIVHPAVAFHLKQWAKEQKGTHPSPPQSYPTARCLQGPQEGGRLETTPICFVESAILFASGLDQLCDKIVVVTAPEALRIERTIQRDYRGERTAENIAKVKQRIAAQTEEESAMRRCQDTSLNKHNFILTLINDGALSIEELTNEIIRSAYKM
ncbi:MAG: dephospho-CoA kinase [Paludibacteraceae bacterium]